MSGTLVERCLEDQGIIMKTLLCPTFYILDVNIFDLILLRAFL